MEQDTGKFRTNTKDQYYTKESVANQCIQFIQSAIPSSEIYQWIEPSAGNGVFLKRLSPSIDKLGIDIDPKGSGIVKGDFLNWCPTSEKQRIFFGNPPFGKQSSVAKAFIKHAAKYADVIAFILPRSFVKPSMSRAFPLEFHCVATYPLPKMSFEVNGKDYDVPCIFTIWQKKDIPRKLDAVIQEEGFQYTKADEPFDFAIKRVGGLAGQCSVGQKEDFNPNYHYYVKLEEPYKPFQKNIMEEVNRHTFPSNTTGPRSLSKSEINEVLNPILQQVSS
jgi:hypothetical protein